MKELSKYVNTMEYDDGIHIIFTVKFNLKNIFIVKNIEK